MRLLILALGFILYSCSSAEKNEGIPESNPEGMVWIAGGSFNMGGDDLQAKPDELPLHQVSVSGFWMDIHEVTNAQFEEFANATGYLTVAERTPDWEELKKQLPLGTPKPPDSVLVPASLVFEKDFVEKKLPTWNWVPGANWRQPLGPESTNEGQENYPVIHIAWEDAQAYADWAGKRLPTEAEWEYAARGGVFETQSTRKQAAIAANIWHGTFPYSNSEDDGHYYSAPVKSFEPNILGLYDMAGNVWEWTQDWYDPNYYKISNGAENPVGPDKGFDPFEPTIPKKVVRGGSFLCHESYCAGYRVSARMRSSPDTGLLHTGFRLVKDYTPNDS
ncbi:MAG: formylglycine-generating enzyme family protein [Balneola sp.]|nr:MAG: formylglycine-generating enzyme family protein [Balneola sp.]